MRCGPRGARAAESAARSCPGAVRCEGSGCHACGLHPGCVHREASGGRALCASVRVQPACLRATAHAACAERAWLMQQHGHARAHTARLAEVQPAQAGAACASPRARGRPPCSSTGAGTCPPRGCGAGWRPRHPRRTACSATRSWRGGSTTTSPVPPSRARPPPRPPPGRRARAAAPPGPPRRCVPACAMCTPRAPRTPGPPVLRCPGQVAARPAAASAVARSAARHIEADVSGRIRITSRSALPCSAH